MIYKIIMCSLMKYFYIFLHKCIDKYGNIAIIDVELRRMVRKSPRRNKRCGWKHNRC